MRYLGDDEATQVMGIGYAGEVAQGADGNLYQWVQGIDGLGNPVGAWQRWMGQPRRAFPYHRGRRFLRRVRYVAPVPMAPVVVSAPPVVCPTPQPMPAAVVTPEAMPAAPSTAPASMPGAAPVAPAATATAGWGLGENDLTQVMGLGQPGEVRTGPDGNLYQWVQGVDGLGNPVGWGWALRRLRKAVKRVAPFVQRFAPLLPGGVALTALRAASPLLRRALPLARRLAPYIPGPYGTAVATALRTATPVLQRAGVAGGNGLGALYQAPDGSLYQVQGLAEDEELQGLAEDEELRGFAADEELRGIAEGEELQGLDQGYVRDAAKSGLEAYMPEQPPQTRWFAPPAQAPEMWKPLW